MDVETSYFASNIHVSMTCAMASQEWTEKIARARRQAVQLMTVEVIIVLATCTSLTPS